MSNQKHPKTQDQCADILQSRLEAIKKYIIFCLNKEKFTGNESERREALKEASLEERSLERAINMIYDDSPIGIVLATDYCKGRYI